MTTELVFIHGRAQEHKDSVALKAEWIDAFVAGLANSNLQMNVSEADVRFPYYGQTLYDLADDAADPDAAEVIVRGSADPDERREAAEAINRRFGEQLYNLWADWITWATAHQSFVHNVGTGLDLPDGATSADHGWRGTGVVNLSNLWLDQ